MQRRTLLGGALGAAVLTGCGAQDHNGAAATPTRPWKPSNRLRIPPLLEPALEGGRLGIGLTLQAGQHEFLAGRPTPSWGINGNILGPTLHLRRGQSVAMSVRNTLPELSTIHWHGLESPAAVDGGPHQPIEPGATWSPQLRIDQPATTAWYHPHAHGTTALHVHQGLAGMIIVDDDTSTQLALPHRYGVDDIPLVLQDRSIGDDGSSVLKSEPNFGYMGTDMCVNATLQSFFDVRTNRVRCRVLNGSNARLYNLALSDNRTFAVVATDSGLLPAPVTANHVRLGPGERLEMVVDFAPGETVTLQTRSGRERIDEGDFNLLEFRATATLEPLPPVPSSLGGAAPLVPPANARVRQFKLQGHDAINGRSMDMARIDEVVPRSALEIWELKNTVYSHNFHIHGVSFTVLDVNGEPPPAWAAGRKDTVHLPDKQSARLAVQFGPHVDPQHPYMYHCHILRHEDAGMMGQYVVVEPGQEATAPRVLPLPANHAGAVPGAHAHGG